MVEVFKVRFFNALTGSVLVCVLTVLGAGIILLACDSPGFSDSDTPTDSTVVGTATLHLSNRIEQEPGPVTCYLFPKGSIDFANAVGGILVGKVEAGASKTFKVEAGSWKLAYRDGAGTLFPMIDEASGNQEWLRSDFTKGGDYSVILISDGNRTVWVPDYTTVPPLSH